MPVYSLDNRMLFPDPSLAEYQGLLAVGGDLSPERLVLAYSMGIFPWFSEEDPILWWSPDPRSIVYPESAKFSKSLRQTLRNSPFEIKFDTDFKRVVEECAAVPREDQDGTWITTKMKKAYLRLHEEGFAHSVEVYQNGKLTGGLYGVSLGKAFFGESMFHHVSNASKIAFFHLVERLKKWDFHFIDAQVKTDHLQSLGAVPVPRKEFLKKLQDALKFPTHRGKW